MPELRNVREWLSGVAARASERLDEVEPRTPEAYQCGARLRMAQEMIQMIDNGEFGD